MTERNPDTSGLTLSTFTRATKASISARTPESENGLVVKWVDFHRLERLVSALGNIGDDAGDGYAIGEGVFWGISSAAFLETISAYNAVSQLTAEQLKAQSSPYQIIITYVIIFVFALTFAFALRNFRKALQGKSKESITGGVQRIVSELTTIRDACNVPSALEHLPTRDSAIVGTG